jgi:D-threo-aldose 1-dehydrogenase
VSPALDERVPLGRGGLTVPRLSFGGAPIGNLGTAVTDEDAEATVHAAWDAGMRYFDVAPHYGIGLAEVRLGRALSAYPRDEYVLSTKVGRLLFDSGRGVRADTQGFAVRSHLGRVYDYSGDGARRSLDDSMRRLGTDRIDIAYVHDADGAHYGQALEGAFVALDELRRQGVIRSYGAGMNGSEGLVRVLSDTDSDVVLAARTWNLAEHAAGLDLLPAALARGVSVVVGGVFFGDAMSPTPAVLKACAELGAPVLAAALQFPLTNPAVSTILVGLRSPAEVRADVTAFAHPLPLALWHAAE